MFLQLTVSVFQKLPIVREVINIRRNVHVNPLELLPLPPNTAMSLPLGYAINSQSKDVMEGVTAFLEKRTPKFTGD